MSPLRPLPVFEPGARLVPKASVRNGWFKKYTTYAGCVVVAGTTHSSGTFLHVGSGCLTPACRSTVQFQTGMPAPWWERVRAVK